jgi:hypothetical protein
MEKERRPKRRSTVIYEVRATFRAPLEFVFRWCTDYTPQDASYSGEGYDRRILRRSTRAVVLEDLYDTGKGWIWLRRVVRLSPPNRWRADTVGSDRAISVDYRLSEIPGKRTLLTIRARRRPYGIGTENPPKGTWERSIGANWAKFGRALERDYVRSHVHEKPKRTDPP